MITYDMELIEKYSYLLTPDVMEAMPGGITGDAVLVWKTSKIKALLRKQAANEAANNASDSTENESEKDTVNEVKAKTASTAVKKTQTSSKSAASAKTKKDDLILQDIRHIHKDVIDAMRSVLPGEAGRADLLTAFVYIFTDGCCSLTPKAAEMVDAYQKADSLMTVKEQLGRMEKLLRENRDQLYSIELCTNFDLYDRRFGAKQPRRRVEEIDFCEPESLRMLEKLRYQGREQRKIDNMRRGRNIYAETKDKNDKK